MSGHFGGSVDDAVELRMRVFQLLEDAEDFDVGPAQLYKENNTTIHYLFIHSISNKDNFLLYFLLYYFHNFDDAFCDHYVMLTIELKLLSKLII